MSGSGELVLLVILVGGGLLPPLFTRTWQSLFWCVAILLGLCALLFAMLWFSADPGVFLSRLNTVFAIFAAGAVLAGAALKALLLLIWPPRRTSE